LIFSQYLDLFVALKMSNATLSGFSLLVEIIVKLVFLPYRYEYEKQ